MTVTSSLPASKHNLLSELATGLDQHSLTWLSGYFAGLAEARPANDAPAPTAPVISAVVGEAGVSRRATVLYGSQTGNAQRVAEALYERLESEGLPVRLVRADRYSTKELKDEVLLYIVMSTQGDGDPPDDSIAFVEFLNGRRAPKLSQLKYGVLGLGDSSYPLFCGISQRLDDRLAELGAQRLLAPGAADLDIDSVATPWMDQALQHARSELDEAKAVGKVGTVTPLRPKSAYTRERPYQAELLVNQRITGRDSEKDVRHIEIALEGSGLSYQPGDALGVWPTQSDSLVDQIVDALALDGNETVVCKDSSRPLREWLTRWRELTQITRPFLTAHAARVDAQGLHELLQPAGASDLRRWLETRQLIDVLRTWPAPWTATELVQALRPLTPRLYSIASSPLAVGEEVHLTVANVAFEVEGEARWGAASQYLSQLEEGQHLPIFIEENTRFRLPSDLGRDIIMIGPGTGIAPFRAFVQHRAETQAIGRNWLFFGNPHFSSDFLYQSEWQQALKDGHLDRLDLAFSRDQEEKVYVQHLLWERRSELFEWLEAGAHLYVCGDASRMAVDVQETLLRVARHEGKKDEVQARAWLDQLAAQGRYARDVY